LLELRFGGKQRGSGRSVEWWGERIRRWFGRNHEHGRFDVDRR
jgi:hypothetical protein